MKEYNLQVKVRNNYLLARMRAHGYETAAELSRASGVSQTSIGQYLNLKKSPIAARTENLNDDAAGICEHLNCCVAELFPEEHIYTPLKRSKAEVELDSQEIAMITEVRPIEDALSDERHVAALIEKLAPRQQDVLRMRFFDELTFDEIGEKIGVTRERVRQIECKALRKLRDPKLLDKPMDSLSPIA